MSQFIMSYSENAVNTNIGYFEACAEINFGKLAPVKRIGILLYFLPMSKNILLLLIPLAFYFNQHEVKCEEWSLLRIYTSEISGES